MATLVPRGKSAFCSIWSLTASRAVPPVLEYCSTLASHENRAWRSSADPNSGLKNQWLRQIGRCDYVPCADGVPRLLLSAAVFSLLLSEYLPPGLSNVDFEGVPPQYLFLPKMFYEDGRLNGVH